jgi:Na+/H+ antiporter NhaD/arsenite permease-like protein
MLLLTALLARLVLLLTYAGLGLGDLPGYRLNRAAIALVGAALMLLLGVVDLPTAWTALDPNTLIFLFGVMVLNAHLGYAGFFQLAVQAVLRLARSPLGLLVWITVGTGVLSALFLNDTVVLLFTPLVVAMTRRLALPATPYLLALAGAANLGSVATLTGNPQNILVGSLSGIGYLEFARALAPLAAAGLAVQVGLLAVLYPAVRSRAPLPAVPAERLRVHRGMLIKGTVVAVLLLAAFALGYPLAQGALVAAGVLLWTRRLRSERFFSRVDWELLVLFAGLFIVTRAVQVLGVLDSLTPLAGSRAGLLWVTAVLSNVVSNVPAVLLLHPLVGPDDRPGWLLLAAGSTLAGNLTLLGSVANLIVAEASRREGHPLSLVEHLRFGVPVTAITGLLAYWWLR